MIDLHSHIVFGVDDGSQTFDNSLKMLAKAQKDRITDIVASSHYVPTMKEQYAKNFELLQIKAREFNISLHRGCEYAISTMADLTPEEVRPIGNSKFILVDMSQAYINPSMINVFFKFKLSGFNILFAHPERMVQGTEFDELLTLFEENQIYVQINTGSLSGRYGKAALHNALQILDQGRCHALANDAHKDSHYVFSHLQEKFIMRYGTETWELLTEENPRRILNNEEPFAITPRKHSFLERLFPKKSL